MNPKDDPKMLIGTVQMFRIRVAAAESKMKLLRDQARQAKHRRKEAKRTAQRARKQFKRFKTELAELQQTLAKAEAKLFQAGGRALARKLAKARPVASRGARSPKNPQATVRRPTPAAPRAVRVRGKGARKKIATRKTKPVAETLAEVAGIDPTPPTLQIPAPNQ